MYQLLPVAEVYWLLLVAEVVAVVAVVARLESFDSSRQQVMETWGALETWGAFSPSPLCPSFSPFPRQ